MKLPHLGLGVRVVFGVVAALFVVLLLLVGMGAKALKHPLERVVSARLHRSVTIVGKLGVQTWSWSPTIVMEGLTVGNPPWDITEPALLKIERAEVRVQLLRLLRGDHILPRVYLFRPQLYLHQDKQGQTNWSFENQQPSNAPAARPSRLPVIRDLLIEEGKLTVLDDSRHLQAKGEVQAQEKARDQDAHPFKLNVHGTINKSPFVLNAAGGPLKDLTQEQPYTFELLITAGENRIRSKGRVLKPFDLGGLDLDVEANGQDLAELFYLTHLTLPNTPPYSLRAQVTRRGQHFVARHISGKLGASDIGGTVAVDASRKRPSVSGTLSSQRLRMTDLAAAFGGRADASLESNPKGSNTSARVAPAVPPRPVHLFPDASLQVDRVRNMDADVTFDARQIDAGAMPVTHVSAHVLLKDGVLSLNRVVLELPQGQFSGGATIDARQAIPKVRIDVRGKDIELQQVKGKGSDSAPPLAGEMQARAVIEGRGDSVRKVLANANGGLTIILPHGEVRAAFAELAGIDVAEGIGLLLKGDERTEVRCGVAQFAIDDGIAHAQNVIFDTKNVLIKGSGTASLGPEELNFSINGEPKKMRLVRLRTPIEIKGRFLKPTVHLEVGHTLKQGAIAAALAVVATPLAAIFAFVDPGLAKDQNCVELLAETNASSPTPQPHGR
jgi:AsmA family protein